MVDAALSCVLLKGSGEPLRILIGNILEGLLGVSLL